MGILLDICFDLTTSHCKPLFYYWFKSEVNINDKSLHSKKTFEVVVL